MRGGYGDSGQGNLASRIGANRRADPPSPARHCLVDGQPSLLLEWRRSAGWEGRIITVGLDRRGGVGDGGALVGSIRDRPGVACRELAEDEVKNVHRPRRH